MKKNWIILMISACALVFSSKPAFAQVSVGITISAHVAPPPLVVYEQPPCPVDGYIWCPGYWAYTDDGYYWVPGVWVVPPRYGYLWTPPWWGYETGVYGFHPGYWGPHVGFYGGVNYGYGYSGSGFYGGRWEGNHFRYNTAVVNVNRTVVHNVYVDKTVIVNNNNQRRISYNGGPGGIAARPGSQERVVSGETHIQPTVEQTTHAQQARANKAQYASDNHGQPATVAVNRPVNHVQHEPGRTQAIQPAHVPAANHNPQPVPSNNANNHVDAMNNHAHHQPQKTNQPQPIPQHNNPAVPQNHTAHQQMQHPVPRPEHVAPQHQPAPQQNHQPNEPHNPAPHGGGPEKK